MSVTFALGSSASVTLVNEPQTGYPRRKTRLQTIGRTAGGTVYVYEKGTPYETWSLTFIAVTEAERAALYTFFHDTVDGGQTPFTYTDEDGSSHTARFLTGELEFSRINDYAYSVSFDLEIS